MKIKTIWTTTGTAKATANNNESHNNSQEIWENERKNTYILSSANTLKHRFGGRCSTRKMKTKIHFFHFQVCLISMGCTSSQNPSNKIKNARYPVQDSLGMASIRFSDCILFESKTSCRQRAISRGPSVWKWLNRCTCCKRILAYPLNVFST